MLHSSRSHIKHEVCVLQERRRLLTFVIVGGGPTGDPGSRSCMTEFDIKLPC